MQHISSQEVPDMTEIADNFLIRSILNTRYISNRGPPHENHHHYHQQHRIVNKLNKAL